VLLGAQAIGDCVTVAYIVDCMINS